MGSPPDISIVTVAAGDRLAGERFATAVEAVQRTGGEPPVEVVVVAPGRAGRELADAMMKRWEPTPVVASVVDVEAGLPFAAAVNVGVAKSSGDVVVAANLDVTFHQRFLRVLREEAARPEWDVLAATVREGDDQHLAGATQRGRGHRLTPLDRQPKEAGPVRAGHGCCLVVRRQALDRRVAAVGGLFEDAFASGSEDLDFFWWAERQRLRVRFQPLLIVGHGVVRKTYVELFTNRSPDEQRRTMANYRVTVWRHAAEPADWVNWVVGEASFLAEIAVGYKVEGVRRYLASWPESVKVAQRIRKRQGRLRVVRGSRSRGLSADG